MNYWAIDAIRDQWRDYQENKGFDLNYITDEMLDECGFEKYAEYVLREFPGMNEYKNAKYDVDWTWENFEYEHSEIGEINKWSGKNIKNKITELIKEYNPDADYFLEDIDDILICEGFSYFDEEHYFDPFFKKNEWGKQMSKEDQKKLVQAFKEGKVVEFENGKDFTPSEYLTEATIDEKEIKESKANRDKLLEEGRYFDSSFQYYNDKGFDLGFYIDLESIAKLATYKTETIGEKMEALKASQK